MNGIHDMGGMQDMGAVEHEADEPVFHEPWEGRVLAMRRSVRLGPSWNIDTGRFAIERIPPATYLRSSYYERWLLGLERQLLESGLVTAEELASCQAAAPAVGGTVVRPADVPAFVRVQSQGRSDAIVAPMFKMGDRVRALNLHPRLHTRLPRYVRGRTGAIERDLGVFTFPDSWVAAQDAKPQHVYSVRFEARELWGPEASPRHSINLDLWDDYLEFA